LRLLFPYKIYQVSDELESFFFVFLYVGLHFVAHNKPGALNIKEIFEDARIEPNGRQTHGTGRLRLYFVDPSVILRQLQFEKSPPFTDLIRELFCLFQSLTVVGVCLNTGRQPWLHDGANANRLKDCQAVIRSIRGAMGRLDWPDECDKVEAGNYFNKEQAAKMHALIHPPPLPTSTGTRRAPKRGREEDLDDPKSVAKSSKLQK
jgi:hypothetical protein